jgi:hypothetical protein
MGHLLWDQYNCSSNFSVYLCGSPTAFAATPQESHMLHLSSTEGGELLDAQNLKSLKNPRYIPVDVMHTKKKIQSYHGALANMIGEDAPALRTTKSLIPHMYANAMVYESQVAAKISFMSIIIFVINLTVHTYLQS